jgi:ArsR family transcriptional regulator
LFSPLSFYKCLSEDTRLKSLLLITLKGELCVCDLTDAFQLSQPKVSRHLAELRKCGILIDERRGKWVYYKLNSELPVWALQVLENTVKNNIDYIDNCLNKLNASKRIERCC